MAYSAAVERWRPIVAKYFPPELVDKALYVIDGESKGNPGAVGDGGAARGLFQIQDSRNFPNRPDAAYLDNPENNIRYAAQQLGAASGRWSDWGEGATYKGKPFGALGNNPYPGGASSTRPGGSTPMTNDTTRAALQAQVDDLISQLQKKPSVLLRQQLGDAVLALSAYDENSRANATLPDDAAQRAFDNAIAMGNLTLSQAQTLFGQYKSKADLARETASAELGDIASRNAAAGAGPSMGERFDMEKKSGVLAGGYQMPGTFEDTLSKWEKKFGAGGDVPDSPATGLPDLPTDTQSTGATDERETVLPTGYGATAGLGDDWKPNDAPLFTPESPGTDSGNAYPPASGTYELPNPWATPPAQPSLKDRGGTAGDVADAIRNGVGGLVGGGKKQAENWWDTIKKPDKWKFGIPHLAGGTDNHRGGPAMLNDGAGPETIIGPDGKPYTLPGGPQVADLPQGSAVLPAGIDPQEALAYMSIREAAQQPDAGDDPMQRAIREADPNAEQAATQSLYKAIVNYLAMNPPETPTWSGTGPDPYAHNRVLTGIPADPAEAAELATAAAKGKRR